jgi:transposase
MIVKFALKKAKMANKTISIMDMKQILRLRSTGMSIRQISRELGLHRKTVSEYIKLCETKAITYDKMSGFEDTDMITEMIRGESLIKEDCEEKRKAKDYIGSQDKYFKNAGFSVKNLYKDYVNTPYDFHYSEAQFYRIYNEVRPKEQGSLKLNHRYGDKAFIDYAGEKLHYIDLSSGEEVRLEVFVGILPASQYIFAEASINQKKESFISSTINMLEYFGGVPKVIVSDNLKSSVTKSGRHESVINKTFKGMSEHYNTIIDPARPYHPKDKAMVEGAVKIVYYEIFYELKKHKWFSLESINAEMVQLLNRLNSKKLSNRDESRKMQFDVEKQTLIALPQRSYELKYYKRAKVQKMGYIIISDYKNYYSVPYRFIDKYVEVIYNNRIVEIYYNKERIGMHQTSMLKGHYSTNTTHLSSANKFVAEWSPEYFIKLAGNKGMNVQKYIEKMIAQKPYPEVAYKQALGIMALSKTYGEDRLEKACQIGLEAEKCSYFTIEQILKNKKDLENADDYIDYKIPQHENIRGAKSYS